MSFLPVDLYPFVAFVYIYQQILYSRGFWFVAWCLAQWDTNLCSLYLVNMVVKSLLLAIKETEGFLIPLIWYFH